MVIYFLDKNVEGGDQAPVGNDVIELLSKIGKKYIIKIYFAVFLFFWGGGSGWVGGCNFRVTKAMKRYML